MPDIKLENLRQDLVNDCEWMSGYVALGTGNILVDSRPFGTYIVARYPDSGRPPDFIVNAIDGSGRAVLSIAFEYRQGIQPGLRMLAPAECPWQPDGLVIGPMPQESELARYTLAKEVLSVAAELVLLEPLLHPT